MTQEETKDNYDQHYKQYSRLGENVKQAMISFLEENDISYHSISHRIKEFESYYEKIDRKGYNDPFNQIEDFCGLRVICFYPKDVEKVGELINREFFVQEAIDKSSKLEPDRFGYRSSHYIVKIKKEWCEAPNYRGLGELKAEIQVRTILMHAWADIEHKLAYKKKDQIPEEFRRKLYQLSALLEIADSQFQELKKEKETFIRSLIIEHNGQSAFDLSKELSLDTLQAFLDFYFPNRKKDIDMTRSLIEELNQFNINLEILYNYYLQLKPYLDKIEVDIVEKEGVWAQAGIVRAILDISNEEYYSKRPDSFKKEKWGIGVRKWKEKLQTI